MTTLLVIPARYASSRYPGKPLAVLTGATGEAKSLIQRTWEAGQQVSGIDRAVIATDDDRIRAAAEAFGAEVVMTAESCRNGTERCADTLDRLGIEAECIVNLQGDAPLTPPWFLDAVLQAVQDGAQMATPVLPVTGAHLADLKADRAAGRVGGTTAVMNHVGEALYFSKEVLPFTAMDYAPEAETPVWHHVGVYAYTAQALARYLAAPETDLERHEGLEQLRFMAAGICPVSCVPVDARGRPFWELNNPEDVPRIEAMMKAIDLP